MNDSKKFQIDYPEDFYFFDSVIIAQYINKMPTEIERLRFLESLKMEFDNGSSFCKHHIKRIVNSRGYIDKFQMIQDPSISQSTKDLYDDLEIFIKERFTQNKMSSWEFFFKSSEDYIFLTHNLALFFYGKDYNIHHCISIRNNSFSRFYEAIHDIYFHCSPLKKLSRDRKFLLLLKNINCFSKMATPQIYDRLIHT